MNPEFFNIGKALIVGQVIHQKNTMSTLVISTRNGPKPLLTGSVPYLQLNNTAIDGERPFLADKYLKRKSTPMVAR
jgi:hypothetical protein